MIINYRIINDCMQQFAQPLVIIFSILYFCTRATFGTLTLLFLRNPIKYLLNISSEECVVRENEVLFFDGIVTHYRKKPMKRRFVYPLRMALVNLSEPPLWWTRTGQNKLHLTAKEVLERCKEDVVDVTDDDKLEVRLLTSPMSFGYHQNPISVYYVIDKVTKEVLMNVTEVTNTPWGETVRMNFNSKNVNNNRVGSSKVTKTGMTEVPGAYVPKALHVSPFMDMKSNWRIFASDMPTKNKQLKLTVDCVEHPEYGNFFHASFVAKRDDSETRLCRNDYGGIRLLYRRGLSPHRVAFWIYHQAILLLRMGATFYSPPGLSNVKRDMLDKKLTKNSNSSKLATIGGGCPARVNWEEAKSWPWKT